jgi:hypothetical protein
MACHDRDRILPGMNIQCDKSKHLETMFSVWKQAAYSISCPLEQSSKLRNPNQYSSNLKMSQASTFFHIIIMTIIIIFFFRNMNGLNSRSLLFILIRHPA